MAASGIGIDIGTRSIRVVAGAEKKGVFAVTSFLEVMIEEGDDVAEALGAAIKAAGLKGEFRAGLTGRDVVIRYNQVPPVPDWQLKQLMEFEIAEMVSQSGEPLAADFNLIPISSDLTSDDTVLLALAKPGILASHTAAIEGAGAKIAAFTPNSIALYNAFKRQDDTAGTVLLVNIGHANTDMVIAREGDLLFARNLTGGSQLFDDALSASFNVSAHKARQLKEEMADVGPPDAKVARKSPQEEKVARALAGATGQLLSMVQSSVLFARSQTGVQELKLDRVLLCGGGALLKGLDQFLGTNLEVPVKRFDAFEVCDTTAVDAELDEAGRAKGAIALGLAMQASFADAYSIEILPEAMKKKRAFAQRTIYAILAAVLALGCLGVQAFRAREDFAEATKDADAMRAKRSRLEKQVASFTEGLATRKEGSRKVELLHERLIPGVGMVRTLALLQRHLPEELYVKSVAIKRVKDPALGIDGDLQPVIEINGEGKELNQGLAAIFNKFAEEMKADPLFGGALTTKTAAASPKKPFEWSMSMNFSKLPAPVADAAN